MRATVIVLLSGILIAIIIGFVQFFSSGSTSSPISVSKGPSSDGGLYRSEDMGETFSLFSNTNAEDDVDISKIDITELLEDPTESGTWWVATVGGGLFVWNRDAVIDTEDSENGEDSTEPIEVWLPVWGQDDVLRESNIRALARTGGDGVLITLDADNRGRIWKSADVGASFRETYSAASDKVYVTALSVAPTNPNRVLAGLSDGLVIGSSDGGETWTALQEFGEGVKSLEFTRGDANTIYGVLGRKGAIRSRDGGATFEELSKIKLAQDDERKDMALSKYTGSRAVSSLALHPNDAAQLMLATAGGLLRSRDYGVHWELLPVPILPDALPIRAAAFDSTNPNVLHSTAGDGFYTSFDDGANWRVTRFTITPELSFIKVSREDSSLILVGTTDK